VSVPLLHDAHNGNTIIDATDEVDSLVVLHDTNSAELGVIVKGGSPSGNDKVSFVHVYIIHNQDQGCKGYFGKLSVLSLVVARV